MSEFQDYKGLTSFEYLTVIRYCYTYDKKDLGGMIRQNPLPITEGMKQFIADVFDGNIERPKGQKQSTIHQDIRIMLLVEQLFKEGRPLRSNTQIIGAADLASELLSKNEDLNKRNIPLANRGNSICSVFISPEGVISAWKRAKYFDSQHHDGVTDRSVDDILIENLLSESSTKHLTLREQYSQ